MLFIGFGLFLSACQPENNQLQWEDIGRSLQTKLINAKDGDTVIINEGRFLFTKGLTLEGKSNVVIKGAGAGKSVLSFKDQAEGAEGFRISNCINISLEDFTIEDAKGDNIKITETEGIRLARLHSVWTGKPSKNNGAYAFYPVLCKYVLIEECTARGASDAGIYVGQSEFVIIKNCIVEENVAGIESENSAFVDIFDNHCINNTGGILVFDLPGLTRYGRHIRVFNNTVLENNHRNFAPKGNIVGMVPSGTGVMVLASREVEIFDNTIENNKTSGVAIISYELVLAMDNEKKSENTELSIAHHNNNYSLDTLYNPFPSAIFIHSNRISNKYKLPSLSSDFGKLLLWKFFFKTPDILFDGFFDAKNKANNTLCIKQSGIRFANLDVPGDFAGLHRDISQFECSIKGLTPVDFTFPILISNAY
jgi:parallel beta-helix repeat protein